MKYQRLIVAAFAGAVLTAPAAAQTLTGFYGGVILRDGGSATSGVAFGPRTQAVAPAAAPVEDITVQQQRVFGGYKWRNDLALEAAFARTESYALRPFGVGAPGGVGLTLVSPQDGGARSAWNVDVVGSYTFLRAFALYGRVGYAQEVAPPATANLLMGDVRRPRDGMNYGLGMRYDVNRVLGLNLEYTRFGRIGFETFGSTLPENDQVRLGVQLRF
jgi:hypothetical protein